MKPLEYYMWYYCCSLFHVSSLDWYSNLIHYLRCRKQLKASVIKSILYCRVNCWITSLRTCEIFLDAQFSQQASSDKSIFNKKNFSLWNCIILLLLFHNSRISILYTSTRIARNCNTKYQHVDNVRSTHHFDEYYVSTLQEYRFTYVFD